MITGTSLFLTGDGFTGVAPDAPTNFNATDDENCQITFTWTNSTVGDPVPTYELWSGGLELEAENITSPFILSGIGIITVKNYYVKAVNSALPQGIDSNIDAGVAIDTRPAAFTLSGTTDENGQITFTWTEEAGCTYELFEIDIFDETLLRASSITSPHAYTTAPEITEYFVRATNTCGATDSYPLIEAYSTELPTEGDVVTSGLYIRLEALSYLNTNYDRGEWHVIVGGIETFSGSAYKLLGTGYTFFIGPLPTIYSGQVVTVSHDTQEFTVEAFTAITLVNNSTVFESEAPVYLMTEVLEEVAPYWYLGNSSTSGGVYDGRLEHSPQSIDGTEGDPWLPSNPQYPDDPPPADGWINLNINGNATRQINTQWTPPNSEWTITAIYNVVVGTSYEIYALHYDGVGSVDIYQGDESTTITLVHSNIPYTPPTTPWIIKSTPPEIITVNSIIYKMDSFTTV